MRLSARLLTRSLPTLQESSIFGDPFPGCFKSYCVDGVATQESISPNSSPRKFFPWRLKLNLSKRKMAATVRQCTCSVHVRTSARLHVCLHAHVRVFKNVSHCILSLFSMVWQNCRWRRGRLIQYGGYKATNKVYLLPCLLPSFRLSFVTSKTSSTLFSYIFTYLLISFLPYLFSFSSFTFWVIDCHL